MVCQREPDGFFPLFRRRRKGGFQHNSTNPLSKQFFRVNLQKFFVWYSARTDPQHFTGMKLPVKYPHPFYAGLFGDVFHLSAGLQILVSERLWLKEDLSASFQQKN
jgi:hypothetical protein